MNIVISGASQGIGYEIAVNFALKGHKVLAIARNRSKLENLYSESSNISVLEIDLTDKTLRKEIDSLYKGKEIDIVINNAGQLINKPFLETSLDDFKSQYESNLITSVNLVQSCYPYLGRNSHIVNISSMGGFQGSSKFSGLSAYSSSKGALSILSECMAEEFKEKGVKVNALALGAVQTEMLSKAFPEYQAPLSAKQMASFITDFALNSGEFINGKVLPVAIGNP